MLEDHDGIGVLNRRKTVGNNEHRPTMHQCVHTALYDGLGTCINGRGSLVQNHDRGIGHSGPGDAQQLPLALAQVGTVAMEYGIVTLGQTADEIIGTASLAAAMHSSSLASR